MKRRHCTVICVRTKRITVSLRINFQSWPIPSNLAVAKEWGKPRKNDRVLETRKQSAYWRRSGIASQQERSLFTKRSVCNVTCINSSIQTKYLLDTNCKENKAHTSGDELGPVNYNFFLPVLEAASYPKRKQPQKIIKHFRSPKQWDMARLWCLKRSLSLLRYRQKWLENSIPAPRIVKSITLFRFK